MTRSFGTGITAALMAESTGELLKTIIDIDHDDMASTLRVVNNNEDISVSGTTYTACMFDVSLPGEREQGSVRGRITFPNADQWLTPSLRSITGPPILTVRQVSATNLAASPPEFDTVERTLLPMPLVEVQITGTFVRGTILRDLQLERPFPAGTYSRRHFKEINRRSGVLR